MDNVQLIHLHLKTFVFYKAHSFNIVKQNKAKAKQKQKQSKAKQSKAKQNKPFFLASVIKRTVFPSIFVLSITPLHVIQEEEEEEEEEEKKKKEERKRKNT